MYAVLRFLRWVLFLIVAFIVVTFMVQNREMVEVSLWPLPFVKPAPLWADHRRLPAARLPDRRHQRLAVGRRHPQAGSRARPRQRGKSPAD